jgi:hypothetical protein
MAKSDSLSFKPSIDLVDIRRQLVTVRSRYSDNRHITGRINRLIGRIAHLDKPDNARHQRDIIRMISRTYGRIEQLAPKSGAIDTATEVRCDACDGLGFPSVKQPAAAGRQIYPEPCKKCDGKGRLKRT